MFIFDHFFAIIGWLSTWNSWIFGNLQWCYRQAEECSFSSENLNCSLPDLLLKQGERVHCLSCRFVWNSLFNLFLSKLLNSTLSGVHHIPGPYINTYNKVSRKRGKDRKDINKSVTLALPVFCTFKYLISSCNKCYLIFLYIDATGYWLHLGDFYNSSSCLEVFLIHKERSKHLVKPWMKVTEAMQ